MALDTFIAGQYTATYNAVSIGITSQGFELTQETKAEMINQSDAYGDSIIDFIHRGGSVYMMTECKAYKAGSTTPFYPWATLGQMVTAALPIGRLASDVASATVLTSVAATPAVATPASLTASKSILPPDSNLKLLYDSRLRVVPIRLLLLPYTSTPSTTIIWYTLT